MRPSAKDTVIRMRAKGATYSRLADLYSERDSLAEEYYTPVVPFGVFTHAERVLDALDTALVDAIRVGLSDSGGLELHTRHDGWLFVASLNPGGTELNRHKGREHVSISSGNLSDEEITKFLEGAGMSYKIKIELEVTVASAGIADRVYRDIVDAVVKCDGPVKLVADRKSREEFVLNLPDSEFDPGMLETMMMEEETK